MLRDTRRCAMRKLYIVRLTQQERVELQSVVKKLKGTGQKVRRAQILLKANADGPNWIDERIAEAYACRTRTVERLRQRFVEHGFDEALNRVERTQPPVEKLLTGDQEARLIATRLGPPPKGYNNWTLRLLARKVVELAIVDSVSYETVRRTLKKTTVRQKAKNPQSTYVRVRRVREVVFSWSAPGASLRGVAWPASDMQEQGSGARAINPQR